MHFGSGPGQGRTQLQWPFHGVGGGLVPDDLERPFQLAGGAAGGEQVEVLAVVHLGALGVENRCGSGGLGRRQPGGV